MFWYWVYLTCLLCCEKKNCLAKLWIYGGISFIRLWVGISSTLILIVDFGGFRFSKVYKDLDYRRLRRDFSMWLNSSFKYFEEQMRRALRFKKTLWWYLFIQITTIIPKDIWIIIGFYLGALRIYCRITLHYSLPYIYIYIYIYIYSNIYQFC